MKRFLIYIIGSNQLQNELLASFLEKGTGTECRHDSALRLTPASGDSPFCNHLILWDCLCFSGEDIRLRDEIGIGAKLTLSGCLSVLFNVSLPDGDFEKNAIEQGIRGIFYQHESAEVISEGVTAILNDGIRCSERISASHPDAHAKISDENAVGLTHREKEILLLLKSGRTNRHIADHLCISVHTVRTHLYNIYRKIEVPNRTQAVVWATEHIWD